MKNKIKSLLSSKVLKNGIWLTILQIVNTVIPLLTIPYITRVLGTEEYGIFSISLNWILYFQVLVEFGFGLSGARKVALVDNDKELNQLYSNIISSRIILFVIAFTLLNIIAFFSKFNLKMYISMNLLSIMIVGTTFQLTWLFQGKQDMKFITIVNVIARVVSVVLTFLLVKNGSDIYIYCVLYSITILLSSIISIYIAHNKYNLRFKFSNKAEIKKEINDGKYLFFSAAMTKIFSGFGTTVLGIVSSASMTGIYSAIYKIPYILTMFFSPISQSLYPHSSAEFKNDFKSATTSIKKTCLCVFIVFLIPSLLIILLRKLIVEIMFGNEYLLYANIVIPLVLQFLLAVVNNFFGIQILVASGNQKLYSKSLVIGCVSTVLFNILLGNSFQIYGVSFAAMLGELVLTCCLIVNYKKVLNSCFNN